MKTIPLKILTPFLLPLMLVFSAFSSPMLAGDSGGDFTDKLARDSTTVKLEAAATVRVENSRGEVTIEGWDQPGIEVTVIRSAMRKDAPLDRVKVSSERRGEEAVIATEIGKERGRDVLVDYLIKAPRAAKIAVTAAKGGVYITGMDGEIEASAKMGQITVRAAGPVQADALAKHGRVYSELAGQTGQKLALRAECGDIVILRAETAP